MALWSVAAAGGGAMFGTAFLVLLIFLIVLKVLALRALDGLAAVRTSQQHGGLTLWVAWIAGCLVRSAT